MRLSATGYQGHERIIDFQLFHSRMIRTAGRGPDLPETIEGYPQRPKKEIHEGPRRGWRKLKRDPPKVGKGSLLQNSLGSGIYYREELLSLGNPWLARCRSLSRALFCRSILPPSHARLRILQKAQGKKIFTKGDKGSVKRAKDESAKGLQGVGKDSKEIREEPRRTLRFSTNAHSIIEPVSFLCNSFSSCLSCLSCVSMFNDAANRINGTWPLLPIGIRTRCFTRVCSASQGGGRLA